MNSYSPRLRVCFLVVIFLSTNLFINTLQQQSNGLENDVQISSSAVADSELDPEDLVDYEMEKTKSIRLDNVSKEEESAGVKNSSITPSDTELDLQNFNDGEMTTSVDLSKNSTQDDQKTTTKSSTKPKIDTTKSNTTIKSTTNKTSIETVKSTSTQRPETNTDSDDAMSNDDEASIENTTTTTRSKLLSTTKPKKQPAENSDTIEMTVKSNKLEEILVEKSSDPNDLAKFLVSSKDPDYQLELSVESDSPIDFQKSCAISFEYVNADRASFECVQTFFQIVNSSILLKVNKYLLSSEVRIKVRRVISGCDEKTRIRDIELSSGLPNIYHNSDHECIYRVRNRNTKNSFTKVLVDGFPLKEDKICQALVQISNGDAQNAIDQRLQAKFDSLESFEPFAAGVLVMSEYTFIKVVNCFENNQPIEISLDFVKRASYKALISPKKTNYRLNSELFMAPGTDPFLVIEIENENLRDIINYKLSYEFGSNVDCKNANKNTSLVTIYGMDDMEQMHAYQYYPCNYNASKASEDLMGFKYVYVQFYRETMTQKENNSPSVKADKITLYLEIKPVQNKIETLTDIVRKVSSKDYNLYLRNFRIDFEIKAPPGYRILLNLKKFDNGKYNDPNASVPCDDFALIRLNKITNKARGSYQVSKDPLFCNTLKKPVTFSSYTNNLVATFYFKQLSSNSEELNEAEFEFDYLMEPFCGQQYNTQSKKLITFSSLQSLSDEDETECRNMIQVARDNRIVIYKVDWSSSSNSNYDEVDLTYMNGKVLCSGSDTLLIDNYNSKYNHLRIEDTATNEMYNSYCMNNPFGAFISESNRAFLTYKKALSSRSKPLIFSIGYFSYRALYGETDDEVNINFGRLIPENVNNRARLSSFDIRIELSNKTNYIVPYLSDCFFGLTNGEIMLKTGTSSVPLNAFECEANKTYPVVFAAMESEMRIEFRNVTLSELRDKAIRFQLGYAILPRVFTAPASVIESRSDVDAAGEFLSMPQGRVEYEWMLNISSYESNMVRLRLEEISNIAAITELSIVDLRTNTKLYDQNELVENYKQNRRNITYLIPSGRLKVTFKHEHRRRSASTSSSNIYPYVRISYSSEPKLLNHYGSSFADESKKWELSLSNSFIKNRIEWLVIAPPDYVIVLKISRFEAVKQSNGQLKFSLLNSGYTYNGTYHFNLNEGLAAGYLRSTDIVVSRSNMLRIEYLPGDWRDSFTLVYSLHRNVLIAPVGMISQHFNELVEPIVRVTKLTDQWWKVRAPYEKRVDIYVKYIDLLEEDPCSKASVTFYEANGSKVRAECGHFETDHFDPKKHLGLRSESNEFLVQFVTQNSNEAVVYADETAISNFRPYKGFLFYYAFVEEPGDCYFQAKHNLLCNYESFGKNKWFAAGPDINLQTDEEKEYHRFFCDNCFVSTQIPPSSSDDEHYSMFVSPLIEKHKHLLMFDYKLSADASLSVRFVYEPDLATTSNQQQQTLLDKTILASVFNESTANEWAKGRVRLGRQMLHDYRLVFVLEQLSPKQTVTVSMDNIQIFAQDLDCAVQADDTCMDVFESKSVPKASCQAYSSACDVNRCGNGGVCLNQLNDEYLCVCPAGFTGVHCETKVDPCEMNRCSPHSKCQARANPFADYSDEPYDCVCNKHYFGKYCEQRYEPCKRIENACNELSEQGVCNNMGTSDDPDRFSCTCSPMYTGPNCEFAINERCLNSECNKWGDENATCIELGDRFVCRCSPGFSGAQCRNVDDCASSPCLHNATCVDGLNSFECVCTDSRYAGKYCEQTRICSQCDARGTLYCDEHAHRCVCRSETHTGSHCDIELDACADKPCVHGECVPSSDGQQFECVCDYGYKGRTCEKREDACDKAHCFNNATCVLEKDVTTGHVDYACECAPGFDGRHCEHVLDPCASEPCFNRGQCISGHANSYTCVCPVTHTGVNCEIELSNCQMAKCAHGSTCHSVLDGYVCKCPPGRFGRYCDELEDRCLNNECQNGHCVPSDLDHVTGAAGKYSCACLPGFTGRLCDVDIDECATGPCQNDAVCVDLVSGYRCICKPGFTGVNCADPIDYCSHGSTRCHPKNYRQCIPIPNGVKCDCLPRYTGLKCEIEIDVCDYEKPCRSGDCVLLADGTDYKCVNCAQGFGGKNCSEMIDYCATARPCQNNATCFSKPNDYFCRCPEKFTGKNCDIEINPACLRNKCMHNSICIPETNGYRCECDDEHEGFYCEKKKDKCKNVTCQYGYCVDGKCECDPKIPFCKSKCRSGNHVCHNNGKCVDVIKGSHMEAQCLCPPGLTGRNCEESIYCSEVRPCGPKEMRQCVTSNQTYECLCKPPFIGHGCSKKLSDFIPEYESYLRQEKLSADKDQCRFGKSKESQILIAIVAFCTVSFLVIGLLFGHCTVNSYKKRCKAASSLNTKSNYTIMSSENTSNRSVYSMPKTPVRSLNAHEISLNQSSAFSIPRPSVRL